MAVVPFWDEPHGRHPRPFANLKLKIHRVAQAPGTTDCDRLRPSFGIVDVHQFGKLCIEAVGRGTGIHECWDDDSGQSGELDAHERAFGGLVREAAEVKPQDGQLGQAAERKVRLSAGHHACPHPRGHPAESGRYLRLCRSAKPPNYLDIDATYLRLRH